MPHHPLRSTNPGVERQPLLRHAKCNPNPANIRCNKVSPKHERMDIF